MADNEDKNDDIIIKTMNGTFFVFTLSLILILSG